MCWLRDASFSPHQGGDKGRPNSGEARLDAPGIWCALMAARSKLRAGSPFSDGHGGRALLPGVANGGGPQLALIAGEPLASKVGATVSPESGPRELGSGSKRQRAGAPIDPVPVELRTLRHRDGQLRRRGGEAVSGHPPRKAQEWHWQDGAAIPQAPRASCRRPDAPAKSRACSSG
jgi:hypothetical protein